MLVSRRKFLISAGAALAAPAIIRPRIASAFAPPLVRARAYRGWMKPAGIPVIDWSHPAAQGLEFYGFDTGGGVIVELVKGRPMQQNTGTTLCSPAPFIGGQGFKYNNSDSKIFSSDARIQAVTAAPPWTLGCGMVESAGQTSAPVPFGRLANIDGSQPFANWLFQDNNVDTTWQFALNSAGTYTIVGGNGTGAVGVWETMFGVARSASVAGFYFNGAQAGADTTGLTIQSLNTGDNIQMGGGAVGAGTNALLGWVPFGGFWSRALSAAEISALHFDPYCFLIFPDDQALIGRQ